MKKILLILISLIIISYIGMKIYVNYNINLPQIPVLAYHNVVLDDVPTPDAYTMKISAFKEQMKYLKDNGYTTLTMDQFYCWKMNKCKVPKKSVLLTFDDGFYSVYYLVKPILEEYGFHGISFFVGNWTPAKTNSFDSNKYGVVGLDIIKSPDKTIEYYSHSYDLHRIIGNKQAVFVLSKKELEEDVVSMGKIIKSEYLAYPYYCENQNIRDILKKHNYKLAFRGENEKTTRTANNYQIPRIEIHSDFKAFKEVLETKKYNNRYGNGIIRKIFLNIERKITKARLF